MPPAVFFGAAVLARGENEGETTRVGRDYVRKGGERKEVASAVNLESGLYGAIGGRQKNDDEETHSSWLWSCHSAKRPRE